MGLKSTVGRKRYGMDEFAPYMGLKRLYEFIIVALDAFAPYMGLKRI